MDNTDGGDKSEICEFFEGRSVLITGATGFIGGILLEHLLRLCPGISEIFILLRKKSGSTAAERRESLLSELPYGKVKNECPEVLEKVQVISGEVTEDDLGISPEDLEKLKQKVSVVFHCAASISFRKDMRYMLLNNVVGVYNIINLCKKFPKLAVFVHTSTAYSNCHREVIKEEVYDFPFSVDKIIEATRSEDEEFMKDLERDYCQKFVNRYILSKRIGENVVLREASDIPMAIVRPSGTSHVWKGSVPGFIKGKTGMANVILGVSSGFTLIMLAGENTVTDVVPVDIVANTLIAAAWCAAEKRVHSPLVLNCISSNKLFLTMGQLFQGLVSRPYSLLHPGTFRTPSVNFTNSILKFRIMSFFYHYVPAVFLDLVVGLYGGKTSLRKFCRMQDEINLTSWPFLSKKFGFKSENFDNLKSLLNKRDSEMFSIDLTGFNLEYITKCCSVNEFFHFRTDDIQVKFQQVAMAERLHMLTLAYKCFLLFLLFLLVGHFLKLIFGI